MTFGTPDENQRGPRLALSPADLWYFRERARAGVKPDALAVEFRISKRTVYRLLEGELVDVELGGYVATFDVYRDQPPRRLSGWTRRQPAPKQGGQT